MYFGKEYPDLMMNRINKCRELARKCNLKEIDRYKAIYDAKVKPHNLAPNSLCWLFTPGRGAKRDILYSGPYVILRKISEFSYIIQHVLTFQTKTVSSHRLKPYIANPNLPNKEAAAAAAAAAANAAASEQQQQSSSTLDNETKKMHSDASAPNKFSDDIVILSDLDKVSTHRPLPLKTEKNKSPTRIKAEPISPNPQSSAETLGEQRSPSSTSTLRRLGSKVFGKRSGFVPDLQEIGEFVASNTPPPPPLTTTRVTRQKAQEENIEIPEIWPLPSKEK